MEEIYRMTKILVLQTWAIKKPPVFGRWFLKIFIVGN